MNRGSFLQCLSYQLQSEGFSQDEITKALLGNLTDVILEEFNKGNFLVKEAASVIKLINRYPRLGDYLQEGDLEKLKIMGRSYDYLNLIRSGKISLKRQRVNRIFRFYGDFAVTPGIARIIYNYLSQASRE